MDTEKLDENNSNLNENCDPTEKMISDLSSDYSQYLKINTDDEFNKFSLTVEEMLAKLDEFGSIVDRIRSDTNICMTDAMPLIQNKCNEMENVFQKIDHLEKFVMMVKENVAAMETELVKAEDQMGSFSGLKKMLSSFVSPKRTQTKFTKPATYTAPEIYKTEDFIRHTEDPPGDTASKS